MTDSNDSPSVLPSVDMSSLQTDEDFFAIGRWLLSRSTCLKAKTAALIVDKKRKVISWGANVCCPQGQLYGLPVIDCPRIQKKTGGQYELCRPIHAEVVAVCNAVGINTIDRKTLWDLPAFLQRLKNFEGFFENATLYLLGHYYACDECVDFLKLIGITQIKFDNLSGEETRRRYREQGLTGDETGVILPGVVVVTLAARRKPSLVCKRHNISQKEIVSLVGGSANTFLVLVSGGDEERLAQALARDDSVETASVLSAYPAVV